MGKLVVAANLLVFINGRRFGEATGVVWKSSTPHTRRGGLDSLMSYGIDPVGATVSGTVSMLRVHGTGGLEGRGIVAPFRHIPTEKYFSILIIDRANSKRLYQADHCKVTEQSWSNVARQRVEGQFSFEALDWQNDCDGYA